jgi:Uma2 family endonuclease
LARPLDTSAGQDYFLGSPDPVVEVVSPSNTMTELHAKERVCLENGCLEFRLVDAELGRVKVSTPDGHSITYHSGQEIPLPLLNGVRLAVDAIFAPAEVLVSTCLAQLEPAR